MCHACLPCDLSGHPACTAKWRRGVVTVGVKPPITSPRSRDKRCRVAGNCLDRLDKLHSACPGSSNKFLFRCHGNFYIFLPKGCRKARLFPNRYLRNADRVQNQSICNNHRVESPSPRSPCMLLFHCLDNCHTQPWFFPLSIKVTPSTTPGGICLVCLHHLDLILRQPV